MRWPWTRDADELRALLAARETTERIRLGHLEDALADLKVRLKQERQDNSVTYHLIVALEQYLAM